MSTGAGRAPAIANPLAHASPLAVAASRELDEARGAGVLAARGAESNRGTVGADRRAEGLAGVGITDEHTREALPAWRLVARASDSEVLVAPAVAVIV